MNKRGFKDFEYVRPDIKKISEKMKQLTDEFVAAKDAKTQISIINKVNKEASNVDTMATLVSIRYSLNVNDEFYAKENEYIDEVSPYYQAASINFYKALSTSKFKDELISKFGKHLFDMVDQALLTFDEKIILG